MSTDRGGMMLSVRCSYAFSVNDVINKMRLNFKVVLFSLALLPLTFKRHHYFTGTLSLSHTHLHTNTIFIFPPSNPRTTTLHLLFFPIYLLQIQTHSNLTTTTTSATKKKIPHFALIFPQLFLVFLPSLTMFSFLPLPCLSYFQQCNSRTTEFYDFLDLSMHKVLEDSVNND